MKKLMFILLMAISMTASAQRKVGVTAIPKTVAAFQKLQNVMSTTPEGAVMMQLVAMEMYNQNPQIGTECIKLANVEINQPSVLRRMPEIFSKKDQYYPRLHLVATYFKGATPENGFNPTKPYTIEVRKRANRQPERSQSLRGYIEFYEVYSSGYDSHWRSCEVIKPQGSKIYLVSNCPSLYMQCKEVPFDATQSYKGLK